MRTKRTAPTQAGSPRSLDRWEREVGYLYGMVIGLETMEPRRRAMQRRRILARLKRFVASIRRAERR